FGMMGDHTIKSQRPRSVHEKRVPQEQADAAKFMAQTGESGVEEWAQWSTCSVTCGQGSQVRTRTCVSPYGTHCSGPLRESRVCNNTALCPVHGVWEEWSPWSLCSFTCGRGQRTRTRSCIPPQYGGRSCDGPETQHKPCNIALCPVDGQWQEWSSWSQCSVTCSNGTQQRSRQCTAAAHGGSECRGPWAESRECYNPECTANGQWNQWGHWSGCSKSCDGGWERRIRICQGAAVTGQQCEGTGEEVRRCSEQRCPAPYEICPEDYLMSMVWKRTPAGDMAFNRCPLNATGTTSRRCSLSVHGVAFWEHPSFARCISNEYRHLQHSIKEHLAKGQRMLAGDGMSQVTKTLLDLTQRKNFYAGDLLVSVEILRNVTDTFKRASYIPASDGVQNFFQIISNLLDEENKEKWEDAQQIYPGSVELMQVIEDFIHIVGMGMMDFQNSYLMTGNPVFIGEVVQTSDHLDALKQVHIFSVLGTPELDAILQVGSQKNKAEGWNPLPRPAGHAIYEAAQETLGFLGCKHTLLAQVQLLIPQHPQVLLVRVPLNQFFPQPVLMPGVAPTQVQHLALSLVELLEVSFGSLLELVQVPLDGILSFHTAWFGVICKLAEGPLSPFFYVIDEDIK
ncbi:PREDICTED: brain-specific angiogenesis inhibitor 3-like, partial [Acanthisitta chloris]|uniref:brain-specific angiogenesis inhibitor 3-like n=1 Tax=Acanthisitta chloris TaxID=57068 RepID=UPI0004F0C62F